MLGLPKATEIKKIITKKKFFEQFGTGLTSDRRKSFDAAVARITITNEISPASLNIAAGENVKAIFVVQVNLRQMEYDPRNIALLSRLFKQKMLLVLSYGGRYRLAIYQNKLYQGDWKDAEELTITLAGLDLDRVWEHMVFAITSITEETGKSLNEQLANEERRQALKKNIERLQKKAWAEKQPKRKFELKQQIDALQEELGGL